MKKDNREISIKEIIWKIAMCWRSIVLCAFLGAILTSTGIYWQNMNSYKAQIENTEQMKETEYEFSDSEERQIREMVQLRTIRDNISQYLSDSVLMNINFQRNQVLILQYYVDTDYRFNYAEENKSDLTLPIVGSYLSYITNDTVAEQIQREVLPDLDQTYIAELVSVKEQEDTGVFEVRFAYPDSNVLNQISDQITAAMNDCTANILQKIGPHSLVLVSSKIAVLSDYDLADMQLEYRRMYDSYNTQWNSLKSSMTTEQLQQVDKLMDTEGESEAEEPAISIKKPTFELKYLLLGAIVGIIAAVGWHICRILLSGKLQFSEEMSLLYEIPVLGLLTGRKKKRTKFDYLLMRLRGGPEHFLPKEAQMELLLSNIQLVCQKHNIEELYVTGAGDGELDAQTVDNIKTELEKDGIQIRIGKNICYDVKSQREMLESKYVLLVETLGISKYCEIEREKEIIQNQEIDLIGCVVLE